jgi:hypothetical protein
MVMQMVQVKEMLLERMTAVGLGLSLVEDKIFPTQLCLNILFCPHHLFETNNTLQCRNSQQRLDPSYSRNRVW